jgi:mannose-6-phosphate isomerase-like protein (cupin superfamily)
MPMSQHEDSPLSSDGLLAAPLAGGIIGTDAGNFVIAEWTAEGAPEGSGPALPQAPLHVHQHDDEAWYVLEGRLRFRLGDREVEAEAGSAVFAPRGTPHTYWNPAPEPARYLLIMTPNTRQLIDELHAAPNRDPETIAAIYRSHGIDLIS